MFRILLAEDEQVMHAYLAQALERSGYKVVAVDRGTAAAPLLEAERFGLLLTDIIIPEMHRIQLARHCDTVSPSTEVIFITGFSGVTLRAGASIPNAKVLAKPFHLKDLVLEVERLYAKESLGELK
ncbi:response regulator [Sphingorhabdus sp.]|uniref:response regulator n=1 Tax=Sphingorhabdus sp. TaxID=1902408 RepID=UPI0026134842|nr:response regulator [Sphingorhabdus sp.]MDH4399789.1 response regulator [Sphingorhabdus sp.]